MADVRPARNMTWLKARNGTTQTLASRPPKVVIEMRKRMSTGLHSDEHTAVGGGARMRGV